MYEGAPYVDEWKPLPPRLHDQRTLERVVELPGALRVAAREVSAGEYAEFLAAIGEKGPTDAAPDLPATGMTFARAREFAAWAGGRLPTEDEWQLAAMADGFHRRAPVVWNWTESEHSDGRTRFVMLKGGSEHLAEDSDWYFDGGVQHPEFSAKLLLPGLGVDASPSIGFRVCWEEDAAWARSTG
jgi:formylglycine-generating enzyme required for sulfatase activity